MLGWDSGFKLPVERVLEKDGDGDGNGDRDGDGDGDRDGDRGGVLPVCVVIDRPGEFALFDPYGKDATVGVGVRFTTTANRGSRISSRESPGCCPSSND